MKKELDTKYNPQAVEGRIYAEWLEAGYFHTRAREGAQAYTIAMPPPNVTAQLHVGHSFDNAIQDILIRWKRMQGFDALWIPGTDHASIATEAKIVERLAREGISKADLGREAFLERAWAWKEEYGGIIVEQLKKLGVSCDWERERFTMDPGLNNAVLEAFCRLYDKGLIYRGVKLINWCPHCKTTLSDAEVEHEDKEGGMWHFRYPVDDSENFIEFATTRPETMLGDTAIAVHPDDERYAALIGKTVTIPIIGRKIPIIADDYVKPEFGTGAVKITPAHDFNDFEMAQRHDLPKINIFNDDGTINDKGGVYAGLERYAARKKITTDFDALGLFVKKQTITHAVGNHDRCHTVAEPMLKLQWFVAMESLAKPAIDAYKSGELRIFPDHFGKVYLHWLENIHDWCISRQLWWGHRIPVYYCVCGEMVCAKTAPESCPKCGDNNLTQDEDVLDTWFSSGLWPFSTLGWPEQTPDFRHFYPTNTLNCGYEILFFWAIRMVFMGLEFTGKLPFTDLYIHGMIRDANGVKMSKNLGNGIDPLEVIDKYGADALRFTHIIGISPGSDPSFSMERVEANRNFLNKIWNASRFVLMNLDETANGADLTTADKWILSRVNRLAADVTQNLDNFELGIAATNLYDFVWDEFCDWYIEMAKPRLYNQDDPSRPAALWTLREVLIRALKLMHPYIPFITEEIFTSLQNTEKTIMISAWPAFDAALDYPAEENEIGMIQTAVRAMRNIRAQMNVAPSRRAKVFVVSDNPQIRGVFERCAIYLAGLGAASEIIIQPNRAGIDDDAVSVIIPNAAIYMPFADLIDIDQEIARLTREAARLETEIARVAAKLGNPGFVAKAPEKVINEERAKEQQYAEMLTNT
ncbi:MAG: valine--tRNA ligase, partial [Defluviitaleaceae bacterium]|nr:valine--tRNA ligase [Defluviitaleaceae bacterium]